MNRVCCARASLQYRISYDKLAEIYRYRTTGEMPATANFDDLDHADAVRPFETFGAWFDRHKQWLDVYEEAPCGV